MSRGAEVAGQHGAVQINERQAGDLIRWRRQESLRIDHNFNSQHHLTGRYTRDLSQTSELGGLFFGMFSEQIGRRRAMEMYLTNRVLSAQEALDWGLVNRVVKAGELLPEARALAGRLADGPAEAHGGVKKLMLLADTNGLESQMEQETRFIAAASGSAEGREGVRAFVEKRKAKFR